MKREETKRTKLCKKMKKKMLVLMAALLIMASVPGIVHATSKTVYYKGSRVYWDYGRTWGVYSYSEVQTHRFDHSATANATFSGWKRPGVLARASQYVGFGTARAYWDCR